MKRRLLTTIMLISFLSTPLSTFAFVDPNTVPDINNAINGSVTNGSGGLNVQVGVGSGATSGAVGQFDWNHFNLGSNKSVNWAFTNNNQTALNRVLGNNMSEIYGKLTQSCAAAGCDSFGGTGKVILINPNGMLFGDGAQVNLNSFTASTFDAQGAKNISSMSGADLANYAGTLNSKFGPNIKINFAGTEEKIGSLIKLDGAKFNIDKTLVMMGKDIEIGNGSTIKTNTNYNYGSPQFNQSFSNVKIIAGNGAELTYQKNGYVNNSDVSANRGLANVDYNIKIGDDKLAAGKDKTSITSGNIFIKNRGVTYDTSATGGSRGSNILIQNTDINGMKLVNTQLGEVAIVGNNYVEVKDSKIETFNTYEKGNEANKNTYSQQGGTVLINGEVGVKVDNSVIQTANSNASANAGDVTIQSGSGSVNVNKSTINSQGHVNVAAAGNANVTNSLVSANNTRNNSLLKNVNIKGDNEVNLGNSTVDTTGSVTIASNKNINIYKGAGTGSRIYAGTDLNLYGKDTTITDTNLSYNKINLYKAGTINNVTLKDDTTLEDRGAKNGEGLVLNASGNLTVDNNRLLKATLKGANAGAVDNQDKITLNSSNGNVSFINNTNVVSKSDINANAAAGSINILNNSRLNAANNVNLNSAKSFIANSTATNKNMDATSSINGKNINITTTGANSDIDFNKAVLDKLTYSERLKLDAKNNVSITSPAELTLNRVDMIAGNTNTVTANNDVTMNNVTMKAPKNNVTSNAGSIKLNNVALIAHNPASPADTITKLRAKGAITTEGNSVLSTNSTKLIANADGNVDMKLTGVNNKNAGIEVSGNQVKLDAMDNKLSISRIVANRLNLDANDKFISANTNLSASDIEGLDNPALGTNPPTQPGGNADGRAYIEVREYNGFNLDNVASSVDENGNYIGFYTGSFKPGEFLDDKGENVEGYTKHFIDLKGENAMGESTNEKFLLVYNKPFQCAEGPDVPTDPSPSVPPAGGIGTDTPLRLPVQNELPGRPEPISNNLTDLSATVVAAAAGISIADEEEEKATEE